MTDNGQALVPTSGADILKRLHEPEFIQLLKDAYCKDASDQEFALALQTARHLKLDPMARQIFFIKRWDSSVGKQVVSCQVSIDGLRLIAERTGKYAGQLGPEWCGKDGQWRDVWLEQSPPAAARAAVLRHDFDQPCYAVARYGAYVQTKKGGEPNSMWKKMPDLMLAKCAEALALRKAFPSEMIGAYTTDEMGQETNGHVRFIDDTASNTAAVSNCVLPSSETVALSGVAPDTNASVWDRYVKTLNEATTIDELKAVADLGSTLPSTFRERGRALWREASSRIVASTMEEPALQQAPPAKSKKAHDYGPPPMEEPMQSGWGFNDGLTKPGGKQ